MEIIHNSRNNITGIFWLSIILVALSVFSSCKGSQETTGRNHFLIGENPQTVDGDFAVKMEYHKAISAKILGNFEEAVYLFEQVLKLDPENHAAMFELATIFFDTKENNKAMHFAGHAAKLDTQNKWYKVLYAKTLSTGWDYQSAARVYKELITLDPEQPEYYFELAFMQEQTNDAKEAIKTYDQLEQLIGIDENVILQKHRLYLGLNKLEAAANEIQKLIGHTQDNERYWNMLAETYQNNGMTDKAFEVYNAMLTQYPDHPAATFALAKHNQSKGNREAYLSFMRKAFANPALSIDIKIGHMLGYVDKMPTDSTARNDAIMLSELMTIAHPAEAKAYAMFGDLLFNAGMLEEALVQYTKSFDYNDGIYQVWQQVFFIHADLRQFDLLDQATLESLDIFPNQPAIYLFNGIAKSNLNQYTGAIKMFDQALMIAAGNPMLEADILANMGDTYHAMGNNIASDTCYENSLSRNPNNVIVLNNYSYYLALRNEKIKQAEEMAAKANQLSPGNASFMDTYAWVLFRSGKYAEAKKWIEKAIAAGGTTNAVLLEHYGDILYHLDEIDMAVEQWIKAKNNGGQSEKLGKKIENKHWYE